MHNKKHSYSSTTVSLEYKSNFCYQYLRENFLGVFMTNIELKEYWEELGSAVISLKWLCTENV